jgi:hypothetical protein
VWFSFTVIIDSRNLKVPSCGSISILFSVVEVKQGHEILGGVLRRINWGVSRIARGGDVS